MLTVRGCCFLGLLAEGVLLAALARVAGLSDVGRAVGLACAATVLVLLARSLIRAHTVGPRPADWITLARAMLAAGVAGLVADAFRGHSSVGAVVALSAVALVLDGFDGHVARRTGTASESGARFDMEVDAFLILVLSVDVSRAFGAWVLAIGAARYVLLGAEQLAPWLHRPVPPRYWRKIVAATQGIVLTMAVAGLLPYGVMAGLIAVALVLLAESFGRDVGWLFQRRTSPDVAGAVPIRPREMVTHG